MSDAPQHLPSLLTLKEACRELGGIDRTTFHAWYTAGRFKVKRVGRRTFLPRTELERFCRTNLTGFHAVNGGEQVRHEAAD